MKINIKATNITITPAIDDYIHKKLESLIKFFGRASDVLANVEVGKTTKHHKSGDVFRAEVHIIVDGDEYYAVVETDDLYAAIDEVKDEITRELTSRKKRTLRLLRKGGAQIKAAIKGIRDFGGKSWRRIRGKN